MSLELYIMYEHETKLARHIGKKLLLTVKYKAWPFLVGFQLIAQSYRLVLYLIEVKGCCY
jgi:hypothetical protein